MCPYILNFTWIIVFLLLPSLDAAEIVESLVKLLVDRMFDAKENIDGEIIASLHSGDMVMISCTCKQMSLIKINILKLYIKLEVECFVSPT